MKRIFSCLLVLVMILAVLGGCQSQNGVNDTNDTVDTPASTAPDTAPETTPEATPEELPEETPAPVEEPVTIRLGGLKGPTTMGMVKFLDDVEKDMSGVDCEFTLAANIDEVSPKLIKGELDIAAVPANLASVVYNNTDGAVQLLAINTLGVTYMIETGEEINSVEDLRGKTIYATGKGTVTEYTLKYILESHGIEPDKDVSIEWKSEPTEVVALLKNGGGIAMLPQPFVTVAQTSVEGLRVALSLVDEWSALDTGSMFVTGVLAVRREFAEKYPQQLSAFLDEYKLSIEFANSNIPEAAKLIEQYDIVKAPIAEKAIPYCNIAFYEGESMKALIEGYYEVLFEQNPASVGGELPGDDFYYSR